MDSKIIGLLKNLGPKYVKVFKGTIKYGSKEIWVPKYFGPHKFGVSTKLVTKIFKRIKARLVGSYPIQRKIDYQRLFSGDQTL